MWWPLSWRLAFPAGWTLFGFKGTVPALRAYFGHHLPPNVHPVHGAAGVTDSSQNETVAYPDYGNLLPPPSNRFPPVKDDPPMVVNPKYVVPNVMPSNTNQIIYRCWAYLGHPDTIVDLKAYFRWGCQPSPKSCAGLRRLPAVCGQHMFQIIKWSDPKHVKALYDRCRATGSRPYVGSSKGKVLKYIPYCVDFMIYLKKKYGDDGRMRGGRAPGVGHHKPPVNHEILATHPPCL